MSEQDAIQLLMNLSEVEETEESHALATQIVQVFVSWLSHLYKVVLTKIN